MQSRAGRLTASLTACCRGSLPPLLTYLSLRLPTIPAYYHPYRPQAIERVNDLDPEILEDQQQLFFHLQQQRLIELIRQGQLQEALEFAQVGRAHLAGWLPVVGGVVGKGGNEGAGAICLVPNGSKSKMNQIGQRLCHNVVCSLPRLVLCAHHCLAHWSGLPAACCRSIWRPGGRSTLSCWRS